MKRILFVSLLVVTLGGCATTGNNSPAFIQQVRQAAVAACAFLPTVATVANIIDSGNPGLMTVEALVAAICNAVAPLSVRRRGAILPTVNGVVVHGRFVR